MYLCKPESFFMNQQYYDKTSPKSIFEYAIPLLDHTLREMVGDKAVEGYNMSGKGTLGQMVEELYYHYKANSNPTPDFEEAGVELKIHGKPFCDIFGYCECSVNNRIFISPSSTIRLHVFPRTRIQSTKYSHPNLWNPHRGFSLTNIRANELNVIYHQGNDNIVVQRLVHFSKLRASAPS